MNKVIANYVLDRFNQDSIIERAELLRKRFGTRIIYKNSKVNQDVFDFSTLFSAFNFPIIVEFAKESQEYYSFSAIKRYAESLKKAAKERAYDRSIDDAVKFCSKYMNKLVKTCEYFVNIYTKTFKNCIEIFNKSFGFTTEIPDPFPRLMIHFAYKDKEKSGPEIEFKKQLMLFRVTPKIFNKENKYHESLFVKQIASLLVVDPTYLKRTDDLSNILSNVEWLQKFSNTILSDMIYVLSQISVRLRSVSVTGKLFKILRRNIDRVNNNIFKYKEKIPKCKQDYKCMRKFVDTYFKFLEKELNFVTKFADESGAVPAFQLKSYVRIINTRKPVIDRYVKVLIEYKKVSLIAVKYFLDRFFIVFQKLYQDKFKAKSLQLEKLKDENLNDISKFYAKNKKAWQKLFISTEALEEMNKVSKEVYALHETIVV